MAVKIYFDSRPLFLCDKIDKVIEPYLHHDDTVFIDDLNVHTVKTMIHEMQLPTVHAGVFLYKNLKELKKEFFKKFKLVKAGGGFVLNDEKEILLMFRREKWDMPKGKLDKGEKIEDCAVREVEEETGLTNVKLIKPLTITYHTYPEGTKYIMKESHWYKMKVSGDQTLIPQTEEDITELKWVKSKDLDEYLKNAHSSIADVVEAYK